MSNLKLTQKQYDWLLRGINGNRIGRNPQGFSHLEQWDVRRTLTQIFGFGGWEVQTLELACVKEIENPPGAVKYRNGGSNDKTIWTVVYRAQVRLTVYGLDGTSAHFDDGATGDAQNQPSVGDAHDQATKTALSQALKRAAVNLGDQFGLSLYNGGKIDPVVKGTFVPPDSAARADAAPPPADAEPVRGELDGDDDGQTYVDEDDGQTYAAPPSGGLADDMRDADVHPLPDPPRRPASRIEGGGGGRLDAAYPPPLAPAAHRTPEGQRALARDELATRRATSPLGVPPDQQAARQVNGHAAGQLPPPADDEPVHVAGARAVERARAQAAAQRQQQQPAGQQQREPQRPAPRPAPAGDPETAALVEAIVHAQNAEQVTRLWGQAAGVRPQGRTTDVRGYLEAAVDDVTTAASILGPIFAQIKVDPAVAIPVGALVVAAGKHLEAEDMSLHDHIAAELAVLDPVTGRAVTPPVDAVPAR